MKDTAYYFYCAERSNGDKLSGVLTVENSSEMSPSSVYDNITEHIHTNYPLWRSGFAITQFNRL